MLHNKTRERLLHMMEAAMDAVNFVAGCSYEDFAKNRMMQNAVIRSIEIIGEAGTHITPEYRTVHPEIPWREIIGVRNHLITHTSLSTSR